MSENVKGYVWEGKSVVGAMEGAKEAKSTDVGCGITSGGSPL